MDIFAHTVRVESMRPLDPREIEPIRIRSKDTSASWSTSLRWHTFWPCLSQGNTQFYHTIFGLFFVASVRLGTNRKRKDIHYTHQGPSGWMVCFLRVCVFVPVSLVGKFICYRRYRTALAKRYQWPLDLCAQRETHKDPGAWLTGLNFSPCPTHRLTILWPCTAALLVFIDPGTRGHPWMLPTSRKNGKFHNFHAFSLALAVRWNSDINWIIIFGVCLTRDSIRDHGTDPSMGPDWSWINWIMAWEENSYVHTPKVVGKAREGNLIFWFELAFF